MLNGLEAPRVGARSTRTETNVFGLCVHAAQVGFEIIQGVDVFYVEVCHQIGDNDQNVRDLQVVAG